MLFQCRGWHWTSLPKTRPRGLLKSTLEVRVGEAPQGVTAPPLNDDKGRWEGDNRLSPPGAPHKKKPFSVCFSAHYPKSRFKSLSNWHPETEGTPACFVPALVGNLYWPHMPNSAHGLEFDTYGLIECGFGTPACSFTSPQIGPMLLAAVMQKTLF